MMEDISAYFEVALNTICCDLSVPLKNLLLMVLSPNFSVTMMKTSVLLQRSGLAQRAGRSEQLPPLLGEVLHRHSALCNLRHLSSHTLEYS